MKKYLKIIISYVLLFLIVGAFVYFLFEKRDELVRLKNISALSIGLMVVFSLLSRGVNAYLSEKLLKAFDIKLSFKEWFGLGCVANMTNYFLPMRSGIGTRAIYLKNKYNFAYSKFLAAYTGLYVFSYFVTALFGILLLIFLYPSKGTFYPPIMIVFLAVFIGAGFFMLSWKFLGKKKFKFDVVERIFESLNFFRKEKKLLLILLGLNLISVIMLALRFFVAFHAIKVMPSMSGMIILAIVINFAFILSLTPSNMGIKESIMTIVAGMIGLTTVDGALAAVVDSGVNFIITFVLGTFFSIALFKEMKFKRIET